jgi:hypothetical protein
MKPDTTGESYEKPPLLALVPIAAETVSITLSAEVTPVPYDAAPHLISVSVVHEVVVHVLSTSAEVGVASLVAKLRPINVSVLVPDITLFVFMSLEDTGESYEKRPIRVPTTAETVTAVTTLTPYPDGVKHRIEVSAVHSVLLH